MDVALPTLPLQSLLVVYIRQYWEKAQRNATSSYFENKNPEKMQKLRKKIFIS